MPNHPDPDAQMTRSLCENLRRADEVATCLEAEPPELAFAFRTRPPPPVPGTNRPRVRAHGTLRPWFRRGRRGQFRCRLELQIPRCVCPQTTFSGEENARQPADETSSVARRVGRIGPSAARLEGGGREEFQKVCPYFMIIMPAYVVLVSWYSLQRRVSVSVGQTHEDIS